MSTKFNFGFTLSSLSTYTNELNSDLILEKMFETKSLNAFKKYLTNTGANKLNVLDQTTWMQDGGSCTLSTSGATVFTQQTLTAVPVNITKSYCTKDFLNYWQSQFVTESISGTDGIPFEQIIIDSELAKIAKLQEKAIWQSVDGGATVNLNIYDGLIKVLSGQSCADITTATAASGVTVDTVLTILDEMMAGTSSDILGEDLTAYMSVANYNLFIRACSTNLTSNPLFVKETANYESKHPYYSNLTIKGVDGLAGTAHIVITTEDNIYTAVANTSDGTSVQIRQGAGVDLNFYLIVDFLAGVCAARPEYVTTNFATA